MIYDRGINFFVQIHPFICYFLPFVFIGRYTATCVKQDVI